MPPSVTPPITGTPTPTAGNGAPSTGTLEEGPSAAGATSLPPPPSGPTDWSMFGYDLANTRNNRSETRLSAQTGAGLKKRWTRCTGSE